MPSFTIIGGMLKQEMIIHLSGIPPVSHDDMMSHVERARELALPNIAGSPDTYPPDNGRKLAVVGGGPSINEHVDKLKEWPGDIWTINGTYHWARARGIRSTFIAADPHSIVADWAKHVTDAIVITRCHPKVFEVLKANNATIKTFEIDGVSRTITGTSTATAAVHLAWLSGYRNLTFFGCESCYLPGASHAFMHEKRDAEVIVQVGDEQFFTAPDYLCQAIELSGIIRAMKVKEESGGLLRALIANPKYRFIWISQGMFDNMKEHHLEQVKTEFGKQLGEELRKRGHSMVISAKSQAA